MALASNDHRIRVAQVATTAISVRYLLLDHIERLLKEGYQVEVVCGVDDSMTELVRSGLRIHEIPFVREPSPLADLTALLKLHTLFRSRAFDVVHSHTPKAGLLAPLAARLAGTPAVIHTIHGLLFHDRSRPIEKLLGGACELWTAALAKRLLSQAREDVDVVRRLHMKRATSIEYIGNGIDVERFCPAVRQQARAVTRNVLGFGPGDVVMGMVGRMVREKGFLEFFDALRSTMRRLPSVRGLIVGPPDAGQSDGLNRDDYVRMFEPNRVVWLGQRADLPEVYSAMDIFSLPSYREGMPRTLMEASAMGLPVIASSIRGCREVVEDGATGILVEPRQVGPLAAAMERLADSEELRERMGGAGRKRVERYFNSEDVLERLVAYYARTVGIPRGGVTP